MREAAIKKYIVGTTTATIAFNVVDQSDPLRPTVEENLRLGVQPAAAGARRRSIPEMYGWFPRLAERRHVMAGSLSGRE